MQCKPGCSARKVVCHVQGQPKQNPRRVTSAKLDMEAYLRDVFETGQFNPTINQVWLSKEWFPTKVTIYQDYLDHHRKLLQGDGLDPTLPENQPASESQFYK